MAGASPDREENKMLCAARLPFCLATVLLLAIGPANARQAAAPAAIVKPADAKNQVVPVAPKPKPAPPAPPPVSKDPKDWLERLNKITGAKGLDNKTRADFDSLDADTAFRIYRELLPQLKNESVQRVLFRITLAKTKDPEVINREPLRLLSVFDIALQKPAPVLRRDALQAITPLLLRSFATPTDWAAWRKTTGDRPLPDIIHESCAALAERFNAGDFEQRTNIFEMLNRAAFQSGYDIERKDGLVTKKLKAVGLNAMRRKAVLDSGLFDALFAPLRGAPNDELAGRSLDFIRRFRPDAERFARIDADLKRHLEARFASADAALDGTLELLFASPGEWAMPVLVKAIQNHYLASDSYLAVRVLTRSNDVRAVPLMIELLPAAAPNETNELKTAIAANLLKPEPADVLAKRDASGWADWWAKNKAVYPEPARSLTLGTLKSGAGVVIARIENSTAQYGLDGTAYQQFQQLKTEERFRVLQAVWGQELNYGAKYQLLQMFAQSDGEPDAKGVKKDNPRLLDAFSLGMMDADGDMQQATAQMIFSLTMQQFPDVASFLRWRKQSAGKPLADLKQEGAKAFMARLAAGSEAEKSDLFTMLIRGAQFHTGVNTATKDGKTIRTINATGDIGIRRKILLDGGIVAQAAVLLQSNNESASSAAANFIEQFEPEDADLPKLEMGMKRVYTRWLGDSQNELSPSYPFMLNYKSPWVGALLTQAIQNLSNTYGWRRQMGPMQALMQTDDKRAIPLLISVLDAQAKPQQAGTLQRLAKLTGTKYDAKQDGAFWRKWWEDNSAKMPEEARAIKIATPKPAKDLLIEKLAKSKDGFDYELYSRFQAADAATQCDALAAVWKTFQNEDMKQDCLSIVQNTLTYNRGTMKREEADRRMLELLGLAIGDKSENIRKSAASGLFNIALRDIPDAVAFAAWRKEIGAKSLDTVVAEGTKALLTRLAAADAKTKPKLLESMQQVEWGGNRYYYFQEASDTPVTVPGLAGVRRKTALALKLPDTLARLCKSDETPDVNQKALSLLHSFLPGRAFFAKIEPDASRILPLLARKKAGNDYLTLSMISAYKGKWATDLLLETAKKRYMENEYAIFEALCQSRSPRVIPTLIAIMEDQDGESYLRYVGARALSRLTHTALNMNRSGAWWRAWWNRNKAQMPLEARNEPIPDLQMGNRYAKTFSIKRGRQLETVGHDAHRAYWRLSSGLLISEKTKKKGAKAAPKTADNKPPEIPMAERPGLLVVLADSDTEIGLQASFWQDVAGRGFGGKYLVALVSPPKWSAKQKTLWLTRKNRAEVPEAAFTTETLAADVARDMKAKYPINPAHVFLLGSGAGGPAAYACSLEPQTPFHGFLLMEAAFKSAQLPPLTTAKNRHYYLLHCREDKRTPYFAATLAQNTLRTQGATVKLSGATPNPDAAQQATWQETADGVKWLEAAEGK